jgi:hypothetical protein
MVGLKPILKIKAFKSVGMIRGYTSYVQKMRTNPRKLAANSQANLRSVDAIPRMLPGAILSGVDRHAAVGLPDRQLRS